MSMSNSRKVALNIAVTWVVQALNLFTPLITFPWLSRCLGLEGFGNYLFVLSVTAYCVLLSDYGFNVSSTREISISRDNLSLRSKIFFETMGCKLFLITLSFIILIALTCQIEKLALLRNELFVAFFYVLGVSLTPSWYFFGIEKIVLFSVINTVLKAIFVPITVLLVKNPNDVIVALWIYATTSISICILCNSYLFFKKEIVLHKIGLSFIQKRLKNDFQLFVSFLAVGFYTSLNPALLGVVTSVQQVAIYAGTEKMIKTIESIMAMPATVLFSRVSHLSSHNRPTGIKLVNRIVLYFTVMSAVLMLIIFIYGDRLLAIIYGSEFVGATETVRIVSVIPLLGALSIAFGNLGLLNFGGKKAFTNILLCGSVLNVILMTFLGGKFGSSGAAMSLVLTTSFICISMGIAWKILSSNTLCQKSISEELI